MYKEILINLSETVGNNCPRNANDYIGDDGLLYCGECHTAKQTRVKSRFIPLGIVNCTCKCGLYRAEVAKQKNQALKREQLAQQLKRQGIADTAYSHFTFANDNGSLPATIEAAKWYSDNFDKMKFENCGMLFMGDVGTGKTFSACCIANSVADKGYTIWVITAVDLLRLVGNFNKADDAFNRIQTVDLLVIDDFGTSSCTEHSMSLLFQVIDARYRSNLPLVITTNLLPDEFNNPKTKELQRIYDRIKAMCSSPVSPIIVKGNSIRSKQAKEKHFLIK